MKKILLSLIVVALSATAFAQTKGKTPVAKKPAATTKPATAVKKTMLDSASYGFGLVMANSLKGAGMTVINYDMLVAALKDSFAGTKTMLTPEQAQKCIQVAISNVNKAKFAPNIAEGKAFLEKNKTQPGVKTTASGIQYLVLTQGAGEKPTSAADTVTVNYAGTLINGTPFDSSANHGGPSTFALDEVIASWTEGLQLMRVGSKYRFFVPYNLGYGDRGNGEVIQPYSTLIFEIELLSVSHKK